LGELKPANCGFHAFPGNVATEAAYAGIASRSWLGHATENTITGLYDRTAMDVEHCKKVVEQVGIGFEMSSIVRSVRKNSGKQKEEVAVAA
jgi:hypothetical protein